MTPYKYKKSKKSDKILIEQKNLSKGLFAMNTISQNIRYYPHDLSTKFYAVRLYSKGYPLSLVCRRYHVSKSSLLRWMTKFDGTKESLIDKSHRPLSKHPSAHTDEEIKWIKDYTRRNPHITLPELYGKLRTEKGYSRHAFCSTFPAILFISIFSYFYYFIISITHFLIPFQFAFFLIPLIHISK